jgi:uncharacterized RmlC-like cupin family protein
MSIVSLGSAAALTEESPGAVGLRRLELLPTEHTPTQHLGVGLVRTPVGGGSATPHHHGAAETGVYVLAGSVGFRRGGELRDRLEAGPGQFVFIAPYAVHQEYNPDLSAASVIVVVRDVHGSNYFPVETLSAAPAEESGVDAWSAGLGGADDPARRVGLTAPTLAPGEQLVIQPAGRETALAILAGEAQLRADEEAEVTGAAGQWFYLGTETHVTVANLDRAETRFLLVQGPPVSASA